MFSFQIRFLVFLSISLSFLVDTLVRIKVADILTHKCLDFDACSSGKCQIIHWRLAHKDECVPVETCSSSSERVSFEKDSVLYDHGMDSSMYSNNTTQAAKGKISKSSLDFASLGISQIDIMLQVNTQGRKSVGKQNSSKSNREPSRRDSATVFDFSEEVSRGEAACAGGDNKKGHSKHKVSSLNYLSPCIK